MGYMSLYLYSQHIVGQLGLKRNVKFYNIVMIICHFHTLLFYCWSLISLRIFRINSVMALCICILTSLRNVEGGRRKCNNSILIDIDLIGRFHTVQQKSDFTEP